MKNNLTFLPISVLLSVCFFFTTYGQESDKTLSDSGQENLDPRKYISIYEVDKNTGKSMIVWNGNQIDQNKKDIVPQKVRTIDLNSELKIIFDSQKLRILGLTGNISLQAMVGERRIEVNPYSLIGQSQVNYGIKSKPVSDVARSLVLFSKTSNFLHDFLHGIPENEFGSIETGYFKAIILSLKQLENNLTNKSDTTKVTLGELLEKNLLVKKTDILNKETYLLNNDIIKKLRFSEPITQQDLYIYIHLISV